MKAIAGVNPTLIPNILRVRRNSGKLTMPVQPQLSRYANFKHITGVPSGDKLTGVPLNKLRVIDNLIEKIISQKGQPEPPVKVSGRNIDQLISKLQSKVQSPASGRNLFTGYMDKGLFLNLMA